MHAHLGCALYVLVQFCVVTYQRICCTHLFLDGPKGEEYPLVHSGLALILELVKPME